MTDPTPRKPSLGRKVVIGTVIAPVAAGLVWGGIKLQELVAQGDAAAEDGARYQPTVLPVDPALLTWRQVALVQTNLKSVRSFTLLHDGTLAIAGESLVRILTPDGNLIRDINLPSAPHALAATPEGTLYIATKNTIYTSTTDTPLITLNTKAHITCLHATADALYVADAGNRIVQVYSPTGTLQRELGRADDEKHARGLVIPSPHLDVVPHDGLVWINNPGRHSLEAYDPTGTVVRQWGIRGNTVQAFPGCCNPTDFALFPDGRFVTAEKGIPRIKIFSPQGDLLGLVADESTFNLEKVETAGLDVAIDNHNRVLVLDPLTRTIRIFAPKETASENPSRDIPSRDRKEAGNPTPETQGQADASIGPGTGSVSARPSARSQAPSNVANHSEPPPPMRTSNFELPTSPNHA